MMRIATRGTPLARRQAERVGALLGDDCELVVIRTTGDVRADTPIITMGGAGVFVKEVEQALLDGRADIAVHSAKDLPSSPPPPGLVLAAFPERADSRDALIGSSLADLRVGASVATGSVRRRAQLAAARPDLQFSELRGSIGTRVEKAKQFDAIVVAAAALERLGMVDRAAEILDPAVMMPQVGQGALAVECREDDPDTLAQVLEIDNPMIRATVTAERAFLARLGGGCDVPCGAHGTAEGSEIAVAGVLASLDGRTVVRGSTHGTDPETLGRELVEDLLTRGGRALLEQDAGTPR